MKDYNEVIKVKPTDVVESLAKVAIESLPGGAFIAEAWNLTIGSSLEDRKNAFIQDIDERIKWLERHKGISIEDLRSNEIFIDITLQAASLAIKTSDELKRQSFKNIITNTALNENPSIIKTQLFTNTLDSFTSLHIRILLLIDNPIENLKKLGIEPTQNHVTSSINKLLVLALPDYADHEEIIELVWSELKNAGFHNSGGLKTGMSGSGMYESRISQLGREFIKFISFDESI